MMKMPTEQEINVHNTPDEIYACEHFFGKTLEEAELLFRESNDYLEDMMCMGPKAFAFYIQAVSNFLKSDFANDDRVFVCYLYDVLGFCMENPEFSLALDTVVDMVGYIISNYSKFNVSYEKDGDLKSEYIKLRNDLINMA